METASSLPPLDWGVALRPLPGENVSGDVHVVEAHRHGVLLAVVDGCGHGPEAARAAARASDALRESPDQPVHLQLARCHEALADTRGAAMTLADFNRRQHTLTLCGVGNVEATLFRAAPATGAPAREDALLRGGVVGAQLPSPYASVVPIQPGDTLVMASDGVRTHFERDQALLLTPQRLADLLLEKNFKGNDDALVLVARFRDHAHE